MIRVTWEQRGRTLTLRVKGHAGSAPAGQDLICAGITALVYGLAQTVWENREQLEEEPQVHLSPGDAQIQAKAKPPDTKTLKGAFQTAINGAKLLAVHYPEYVQLTTIP